MDGAILQELTAPRLHGGPAPNDGRFVEPAEFHKLLVSHRRLIRADRRADLLRGLADLDTGEVFLTDERRLLEHRR